jgi:hypothetical protein
MMDKSKSIVVEKLLLGTGYPIEDMVVATLYQGISLEELLMKKLVWKQQSPYRALASLRLS